MLESILAGLLYAVQNSSNKVFSERFRSSLYSLSLLNALALGIASLVMLFFRPAMISARAMWYALGFGALFVATVFMIVLTVRQGPLALSSMIIDMNVVMTVLLGALMWREKITASQCAGIVVLIAVVVALAFPEEKESAKAHGRWLLTALLAMMVNGLLNIEQTAAFKLDPAPDVSDFTFWSMVMGAGLCVAMALILRLTRRAKLDDKDPKKLLPPVAFGVGASTAIAYYFHNKALTILPSLVVFPVVIGLNNVTLMVVSILCFGEKLTLRKALIFTFGILGIILMNF